MSSPQGALYWHASAESLKINRHIDRSDRKEFRTSIPAVLRRAMADGHHDLVSAIRLVFPDGAISKPTRRTTNATAPLPIRNDGSVGQHERNPVFQCLFFRAQDWNDAAFRTLLSRLLRAVERNRGRQEDNALLADGGTSIR